MAITASAYAQYKARASGKTGPVKKQGKIPHRKVRSCPTEDQEQIALVSWARANTDKWPALSKLFHPANGGSRHVLEAMKFKRLGVLPAVPDLVLLFPHHGKHGWMGEMKALDGKPTPAQYQMKNDLCALGYDADIYYGWESARDGLLRYLTE